MPLVARVDAPGVVCLTWRLSTRPAAVWRHLTDVDRLPEWLGRRQDGSFTVGDHLVVDHGDGYLCRSDVLVAQDGRSLAMSWQFPDEPPSRVTIELETVLPDESMPDGATDLHLEHHELADLAGSYLPGWITHLTYFEASLHGEPLPTGSFWRLYETHDRLTARS